MNKKRRFELILAIIVICCFMQVGCENNSSNISYGDVVYDRLNMSVMNDNLVTDDNIYINFFKTYEDANSDLANIGVSSSALSVYDEDYFTRNILLAIAFSTNSEYEYTIKNLKLSGNALTVNIDVKIPEIYNLLKIYRVILIDISKDNLPENVDVEVKTNSIVEK